jgi:uncharacterized 2Fe-2S/4Fe-4S cluster protein (DUF4445 family)
MEKKTSKKNFRVTFAPFDIAATVPEGSSIADAIKKADLPFSFPCGGEGTCGGCSVRVISGNFRAKSTASLAERLAAKGYVLACQTKVVDDLSIVLPQFQEQEIKSVVGSEYVLKNRDKISGLCGHDPALVLTELDVPLPRLEENYSDLQRFQLVYRKKTGIRDVSISLSVLSKLALVLRGRKGQAQVVAIHGPDDAKILDISLPEKDKKMYGLACDIGTSTVAIHLVDILTGKIAGTASSLNQQIKCGEDIISRINYSQKPGHLQELQKLIVQTINNLIHKTIQKTSISNEDIYYACLSGNTTMSHLLLQMDPQYIRQEPYVPTFNQLPLLSAIDMGLSMNPEAKVYLSPSVGSYVGGDITAGLLCTPMIRQSDKVSLFIDAGTNGEIVIGNKDWMMTCACSAGPAFEGGGIKCGMPASEGAIESIELEKTGKVQYRVIGESKPKGLCGSAMVDLLAELYTHGIIDRQGKFKQAHKSDRIIQNEEGKVFLVERASRTYWGKDIYLTEKDIANLLRTKGAVFSAFSLLLKHIGLGYDAIDSIYIAGGFGQHLDVENAIRIGLFPDLKRERFHYIGNSSLLGAYMVLVCDKNREIIQRIVKKMTYIELNTEPRYMNEFTGSLFLPHTDMDLFPSVKKIFVTLEGMKE